MSDSFRRKCLNLLQFIKQHLILFLILAGVVCGFIIGASLHGTVQSSKDPPPKEYAMLLSFPGEILVRMLKLLVLPLIISSVLLAVAELDAKQSGKLGRRTLLYYLVTTILAAIVGIVLVVSIKPGEANLKPTKPNEGKVEPLDSILDLIRYVLFGLLQIDIFRIVSSTCFGLNMSMFSAKTNELLFGYVTFAFQYMKS